MTSNKSFKDILVSKLPRKLLALCGVVLGFLEFLFCAEQRRISRINLGIFFNNISLYKSIFACIKFFVCRRVMLLDVYYLSCVDEEYLRNFVHIEGLDLFNINKSKPKIIIEDGSLSSIFASAVISMIFDVHDLDSTNIEPGKIYRYRLWKSDLSSTDGTRFIDFFGDNILIPYYLNHISNTDDLVIIYPIESGFNYIELKSVNTESPIEYMHKILEDKIKSNSCVYSLDYRIFDITTANKLSKYNG